MAKIISINPSANEPLTPLMIKTLQAACKLQEKNEVFGQVDIDGSFTAAVNRGYMDTKTQLVDGKEQVFWFVTRAGRKALKDSGNEEPC